MEDTVGFALARAGVAHRARAHALLAAVGLHPGQEFLLRLLWERDGRTAGELAEGLGVEPATVTKMLRRLEAAGHVERVTDPEDRRRVRVELTKSGQELESATRDAWRQLEEETVASLSDQEQDRLRELLREVRRALAGEGDGS